MECEGVLSGSDTRRRCKAVQLSCQGFYLARSRSRFFLDYSPLPMGCCERKNCREKVTIATKRVRGGGGEGRGLERMKGGGFNIVATAEKIGEMGGGY